MCWRPAAEEKVMAEDKRSQQLLPQERKEELIAELKKRGVPRACPMCSRNKWTMADGYFNTTLQTNLTGVSIGGLGIPSIGIICSNCGFISHHALGILGQLPKESATEEKK